MTDRGTSVAPTSNPEIARGRRVSSSMAMFALPLLVVAGILVVAWFSGIGETCGGPVPGCSSLRNAGDNPVAVRAVIDQSDTQTLVEGGERVLLGDWRNGVRVDHGQCLVVEGGPFWDARTVIDRTTAATGVWHPVDDWGARVQLHAGACPELS